MKKLLPSILLSFFSFPLGFLLRYIYFFTLPYYGDGGVALLSIVISLNMISLIMSMNAIANTKKD